MKWYLYALLALALLCMGCDIAPPNAPGVIANNTPTSVGFLHTEDGITRSLASMGITDNDFNVFGNFTIPPNTWLPPSQIGYTLLPMTDYSIAVADTATSGTMWDSLWIQIGNPVTPQYEVLTGLHTSLDYNGYNFQLQPVDSITSTIENYTSNGVVWTVCYRGLSADDDYYTGNMNNDKPSYSSCSRWPTEKGSQLRFEINGGVIDTTLMVVSYDGPFPNGQPIDSLNVQYLINYQGEWVPGAVVNLDGTLSPGTGYLIKQWMGII